MPGDAAQSEERLRSNTLDVLRTPAWLAICSAFGLTCALLGDGVWDAPSWMGLGVPLVLIIWKLTARKAAKTP
jgi:hypothetical protein